MTPEHLIKETAINFLVGLGILISVPLWLPAVIIIAAFSFVHGIGSGFRGRSKQ